MRLIDADKLKEDIKGIIAFDWVHAVVKAVIDDQPTIDSVMVVKAKNRTKFEQLKEFQKYLSHEQSPYVLPNDFDVEFKPITIQENKWILCSERMPEHKGVYLTTDQLGIVETTQFYWGECGWYTDATTKIIAWMPLPEAYEEK